MRCKCSASKLQVLSNADGWLSNNMMNVNKLGTFPTYKVPFVKRGALSTQT